MSMFKQDGSIQSSELNLNAHVAILSNFIVTQAVVTNARQCSKFFCRFQQLSLALSRKVFRQSLHGNIMLHMSIYCLLIAVFLEY